MAAESNTDERRGQTYTLAESSTHALSPKERRAVCLLADDGYTHSELAMMFEVARATIYRVTRGGE